jgi:hypothetical protein
MKCPEKYRVIQQNIRKPIIDEDNIVRGEYHLLIENQNFGECYKEKCVVWDNEKQCCRKVGE